MRDCCGTNNVTSTRLVSWLPVSQEKYIIILGLSPQSRCFKSSVGKPRSPLSESEATAGFPAVFLYFQLVLKNKLQTARTDATAGLIFTICIIALMIIMGSGCLPLHYCYIFLGAQSVWRHSAVYSFGLNKCNQIVNTGLI